MNIKKRKQSIPKALREQVWLVHMGKVFESKCKVTWCENRINAFDFQCGHNIPESKGGKTTIQNLIPICGRCNLSMGDQYSIDEWNRKFSSPVSLYSTSLVSLHSTSPIPPKHIRVPVHTPRPVNIPIPPPSTPVPFSRYFCFKGRTTSVPNTKGKKDSNNHKAGGV